MFRWTLPSRYMLGIKTVPPEFSDHFTQVAASYASFRPTYPKSLFAWLATLAPGHMRAWDCACGSGQATLDLAVHFAQVVATDASAAQLMLAPEHPKIEWRVAPAEESGLAEGSVDLITVAQALHWFDLQRFYTEALHVLKPGGVLAAWCYGIVTVEGEAVDAVVQHFYHEVVGPYWPAERHHVETGYQELTFPFAQVNAPAFWIEVHWSLTELLGYLRSWSATARYNAAIGSDPVSALEGALKPLWGEPTKAKRITWPLAVRVGVTW